MKELHVEMPLSRSWCPARSALLMALFVLLISALPFREVCAQRIGGELVFAQQTTPPTLDPMISSSALSRDITLNVFEMLVTRDEQGEPVPDLASAVVKSADGMTYTFELRQGVRFHNGREMTAEDVRASIGRYARYGFDRSVLADVRDVEVLHRYAVAVHLLRPDPNFIDRLSSPRAPLVVIPAEHADEGPGKLQLIGTGPFRFERWVRDAYILLRRFEAYRPNEAAAAMNGMAGRKIAYVDAVRIRTVPAAGSQIAGLEAGEIHLVKGIAPRSARRLERAGRIRIQTLMPAEMQIATLNAGEGATRNLGVRRAILAALDCKAIAEIASDGVYRLNAAFSYPHSPYFAAASERLCRRPDHAEVRHLLERAGYRNEPITIIAHTGVNTTYSASIVVHEQLRAAGLNVKLSVVDFPRALGIVQGGKSWNIWINNFGIDAWLSTAFLPRYWSEGAGFQHKADPTLAAIYAELVSADSAEEKTEAARRFQERMYEKVYAIKLADLGVTLAANRRVHGFRPYMIMRFWGLWLEEQ